MVLRPNSKGAPNFTWMLLLLAVVLTGSVASARGTEPRPELEVFVSEGCPHCRDAEPFIRRFAHERPNVRVTVRDVDADPAALRRLIELASVTDTKVVGVPAFYVGGRLIIGFRGAKATGALIDDALERVAPPDTLAVPLLGRIGAGQLGLPLFTVVVGLLDGFNPCAMWVLLLLLSLLLGLNDRSKVILVGGTFVLVSGLIYFAFMAAWLNVFLIAGTPRIVQIVLGAIALLFGALNIKDFFALRRGPSLSIPQAARPGIYARMRRIIAARGMIAALGGAVVLAVLVNTVELLCTAGLPAIYTRILTMRSLPIWKYYGYLGLYNVAYVLDDAVVLGVAIITLKVSKLQEGGARALKLTSGAVMVALGVILLVEPGWLML